MRYCGGVARPSTLRYALSMPRHASLVVMALCALAGCSDSDLPIGPGPGEKVEVRFESPEKSGDGAPVALVIDSGFDLGADWARDRVLAAYHVECKEASAGRPLEDFSFEEVKASWIAGFAVASDRCRLERGTTLERSGWLDSLGEEREDWNEAVAEGTLDELDEAYVERFWNVLYGGDTFDYHGTYVLAVAAAAAPNARFVVIQRAYAPQAVVDRCPTRAGLELSTRLYGDPEIQNAYAAAPLSRFARELKDLEVRFGVRYENASYGRRTRARRERDCPGLPWRAAYEAEAAFSAAWTRGHALRDYASRDVLAFVSAGNDGDPVESAADLPDCTSQSELDLGTSATVLVGAYGPFAFPSEFSNRGSCVDIYAPGEDVQSWAPNGYRVTFGGTSAAAPLAMGIAMASLGGGDARERRAAVVAWRDAERKISEPRVPAALLYPGTWGPEAERRELREKSGYRGVALRHVGWR